MKRSLTFLFALAVYSLSAQTPITSIPFQLYGDHMLIKVSVDNSEPLDFIFDTGSGLTVIDDDVADRLKLRGKKVKMNTTKTTMELIKHNEIEINGFPMEKNIKIYSTDLDHLEISLGRDIDGIVGYDLMHHHTLHINYARGIMDIYEHGEGPADGDVVPFHLTISIPTIKGAVTLNNGEPHDGKFFIMSGAGTTLDFNSPYAEKWDVIHKTGKHYSYLVKGISEEETLHYEGHVLSFSFGDQTIEDLPIGISMAKEGIQAHPEVAGIIGNQVLSKFNITIDLPGKKLYFQPNKNFDKPLHVNCSGIDIQLSKDKRRVLVHQVFEDSPAAEAGIQLNDELLLINDTPVRDVPLPRIKEMLRQNGEEVTLVLNQNGDEKTVSLALRSLIE
ncbi:aspartyl protease family protein [Marinoscillum furvescens]|nr:aspartyl protease family protein [Marinoscillum furvescens]